MPADPPRPSSARQRRASRKADEPKGDGIHARELELKRSRGEISCAECRRLKIKCDKQIPCHSCQRRGCAALCPIGSLATGQGTRFVVAATDHLHRRIAKMSERIRQLEDALGVLQAEKSKDVHPLLRDELLVIKMDSEDEAGTQDNDPVSRDGETALDAFGTLSISDNGTSRFFGPTGGCESLLLSHDHSDTPSDEGYPSIASQPNDVMHASRTFPFAPLNMSYIPLSGLERHLPPWEHTISLCETYLEQAAWVFHSVSRSQIFDEMLPQLYRKQSHVQEDPGPPVFALLFIIFAVAILVNQTRPQSTAEAQHYYLLSRAAMSLHSPLEKPCEVLIQALHLMSIYNAIYENQLGGEESGSSMEVSWSLVTLAAQLSHAIGLHRDSARWGLPQHRVQRRRALFWDLFVADAWQSLSTGRPPSFTIGYVDCQFPDDEDQSVNSRGILQPGFAHWGFRFAADCIAPIVAKTLAAEPASYSTILELDRLLSDFPVPDCVPLESMDASERTSVSMTRFLMSHTRETVVLQIHRGFFTQAIIDNPNNPLQSTYAHSFSTAFKASSTVLRKIREQFAIYPELCGRFWYIWTFGLSAAVVCGSIATRARHSSLAPEALYELDQACILFSQAAKHSRRAARALPILAKLSERARSTYISPSVPPDFPVKKEDCDDELNILAGHTRLVSSSKRPAPPRAASMPPPPRPFISTSSASSSSSIPPGPNPHLEPQRAYSSDTQPLTWSPTKDALYPPSHMHSQLHPQYSMGSVDNPPSTSTSHHSRRTSGLDGQRYSEPEVIHTHYHPSMERVQSQPQSLPPMHPMYAQQRDLVDFGLAPQGPGPDDRWTSFVQGSGLLDDLQYAQGHR